MTLVSEILNGLEGLHKPQRKFLQVLFSSMLVVHSAINFLSLSRHSRLSERTFRRQFRKQFDFPTFNRHIAARAACQNPVSVALDSSFIKKSGKQTCGLDKFWNGTAQRAEKGLELSLLALIDCKEKRAFALSAEQTPAGLATSEKAVRQTRLDFYLSHFQSTRAMLPASVRYVLVDGFYSKQKFVSGVCESGYEIVSRLRADANLRFLYQGRPASGRGRPRKYDGKVDLADLSRFIGVKSDDTRFSLYTQRLWAVTLKREIQVLVMVPAPDRKSKRRPILLFTTDLELAPPEILRLYRSRFQIEFLFREAKQSAGLETCQARDAQALRFHWNASLASVNLARLKAFEEKTAAQRLGFSMKSVKQQMYNEHVLELFISKLGLDPTLIKKHEAYEKLRYYAVISP